MTMDEKETSRDFKRFQEISRDFKRFQENTEIGNLVIRNCSAGDRVPDKFSYSMITNAFTYICFGNKHQV